MIWSTFIYNCNHNWEMSKLWATTKCNWHYIKSCRTWTYYFQQSIHIAKFVFLIEFSSSTLGVLMLTWSLIVYEWIRRASLCCRLTRVCINFGYDFKRAIWTWKVHGFGLRYVNLPDSWYTASWYTECVCTLEYEALLKLQKLKAILTYVFMDSNYTKYVFSV